MGPTPPLPPHLSHADYNTSTCNNNVNLKEEEELFIIRQLFITIPKYQNEIIHVK
jgi:hypothetical protein